MKIIDGCRVWEHGDKISSDIELGMYKTGPMTMTRHDRQEKWKADQLGRQRRLCYVDDLVAGLILMATVDAAHGEVINLGNPHELTVLEIAQLVAHLLAHDGHVVHGPLPLDDPIRRCPDVGKAQRLLGWTPTTRLNEGLVLMANDFSGRAVVQDLTA